MVSGAPEKIHLIPDNWHIKHVGQLADGRLFLVDTQLELRHGITRDYVCTFIFDPDGHLVSHDIELLGERGAYSDKDAVSAFEKHIAALGDHEITDIWIRPFQLRSHETTFGFVAVSPEEFMDEDDDPSDLSPDDWRVEFMPGNTLSFYPPWEDGEYDT